MKAKLAAACLAVPAVLFGPGRGAASEVSLPADQEVTVDGVAVVCTGVSQEAVTDPRWPAYPVRIEFADARADYLADLDVTISDARGREILRARCEGPWFLAKLAPGRYRVSATFDGRVTRSARLISPAQGQSRTIVRFPDLSSSP